MPWESSSHCCSPLELPCCLVFLLTRELHNLAYLYPVFRSEVKSEESQAQPSADHPWSPFSTMSSSTLAIETIAPKALSAFSMTLCRRGLLRTMLGEITQPRLVSDCRLHEVKFYSLLTCLHRTKTQESVRNQLYNVGHQDSQVGLNLKSLSFLCKLESKWKLTVSSDLGSHIILYFP